MYSRPRATPPSATKEIIAQECLLNAPFLAPLGEASLGTLRKLALDPGAENAAASLAALDTSAATLDGDLWLSEVSPWGQAQ